MSNGESTPKLTPLVWIGICVAIVGAIGIILFVIEMANRDRTPIVAEVAVFGDPKAPKQPQSMDHDTMWKIEAGASIVVLLIGGTIMRIGMRQQGTQ
jgi:hypothetical protein